jgi:hypothetical protein
MSVIDLSRQIYKRCARNYSPYSIPQRAASSHCPAYNSVKTRSIPYPICSISLRYIINHSVKKDLRQRTCCGPALTCSAGWADVTLFGRDHHLHVYPLSTTMTRGKALSRDLRWVIVRMHRALTVAEIMRYTGLKRRTIERVLSVHRNTGGVWPQSHGRRSMAGRNRILSDDEIAVSSFTIPLHCKANWYLHRVVSCWQDWSYTWCLFGWASWCIRGREWGKCGLINSLAGSTKEGLHNEKGKFCIHHAMSLIRGSDALVDQQSGNGAQRR